ncbi:MAG TPA: helix-turn-helix domain-containing protein [Sphingobium sp.]
MHGLLLPGRAEESGVSRRAESRHVRRQVILSEARDLFFDRGYTGTSMSGLAARLGGSKGTLSARRNRQLWRLQL